MDVSVIVAVAIFILFTSLVVVSVLNYFTRTPQSEVILEIRDKTLNLFNIFFGSRGLVTSERVTVDLIRIPILIEEMGNKNWTNEIIGVGISFDEICGRKQAWNNSVRAYDTLFVELPSIISNQELCTSNWLNNSVVTFVVNLTANQTKRTYVYSINNSNTTAPTYNITNITGIVGYWSFDEENGTSAKDFSGNGNNGTHNGGVNCSTSVAGKFETACRFDGDDDYIDFTTVPNVVRNTFSMWIYPLVLPTGGDRDMISTYYLESQAEPFSGTDKNFFLRPSGTVVFRTLSPASLVSSTTALTTDNWYHIAGTTNGTHIDIYVNGILENTTAAGDSESYPNPGFRLAGLVDTVNDGETTRTRFNGIIDDFRIFGKVLSSSEISNLASSIPRITIFPAENITAISADKVQSLKSRTYDDIRGTIGEGYDFRIEIREK